MTDQELMVKGCAFLGVSEEKFWELLKRAREKYPEFNRGNKITRYYYHNLQGEIFNKLFILYRGANIRREAGWVTICNCKNHGISLQSANNIKSGNTKSCGCLNPKFGDKRASRKNPLFRLYRCYYSMINRCYNHRDPRFCDYGKRGIVVCAEWLDDYNAYKKWALNNGYADNLTMDRIDVNGNYEPNNCRWASVKVQANNKRNNRKITHNNETKTIAQWGEELGINPKTISERIKRNWNEDEVFNNNENMVTHLGKSGERGLYYIDGKARPWKVCVRINHKQVHLGYFTTKKEAIEARDKALTNIKEGITDINVLRNS